MQKKHTLKGKKEGLYQKQQQQIIFKLYQNLKVSFKGLWASLAEHSLRLELLFGIPVILVILFSPSSMIIKALLGVVYVFLLVVEILNTAIEALCDRVTLKADTQIGRVKDISSAAVFLVLLLTLVLFIIAALPIFQTMVVFSDTF